MQEGAAGLPQQRVQRAFDVFGLERLADHGLAGEAFSVGDIAVASVLRTLGYVGMEPDAATHPATAAWYAKVTTRPAWLAVAEREVQIMASARRG